jgi:hypothetical protein
MVFTLYTIILYQHKAPFPILMSMQPNSSLDVLSSNFLYFVLNLLISDPSSGARLPSNHVCIKSKLLQLKVFAK